MRHFLASLSAAALAVAITLFIADHTLFTAAFIKAKVAEANVYPDVSMAVQAAIKGDPNQPPDPTQDKLKALITPQFVQTKLEAFADQLEPFLRGTGPRPQFTLAELKTAAAAQGLTVPPDADKTFSQDLLPPNAFGTPAGQTAAKPPLKTVDQAMAAAGLVALLLGLLAIIVSPHQWYKTVARVGVVTAMWLAVTWILLRFAPDILSSLLLNKPGTPPELLAMVHRLSNAVIGGFAQPIALTAIGLGVVGGAVEIIGWQMNRHHGHSTKSAPPKPSAKKL